MTVRKIIAELLWQMLTVLLPLTLMTRCTPFALSAIWHRLNKVQLLWVTLRINFRLKGTFRTNKSAFFEKGKSL